MQSVKKLLGSLSTFYRMGASFLSSVLTGRACTVRPGGVSKALGFSCVPQEFSNGLKIVDLS